MKKEYVAFVVKEIVTSKAASECYALLLLVALVMAVTTGKFLVVAGLYLTLALLLTFFAVVVFGVSPSTKNAYAGRHLKNTPEVTHE